MSEKNANRIAQSMIIMRQSFFNGTLSGHDKTSFILTSYECLYEVCRM